MLRRQNYLADSTFSYSAVLCQRCVDGAELFENEYLIIDKISPHFKPFERGEVIVFRYPKTDHRFLIKRVIGLPGEKVVIKNQAVTIFNVGHPNGLQLDETPYNPRELSERLVVETLAKDEYFVLVTIGR